MFGEPVVLQSAEVGHLDVLTEWRLNGRLVVPAIFLAVPQPVHDVRDSFGEENVEMLLERFFGQRNNLRRQLPGEKLQVLLDGIDEYPARNPLKCHVDEGDPADDELLHEQGSGNQAAGVASHCATDGNTPATTP